MKNLLFLSIILMVPSFLIYAEDQKAIVKSEAPDKAIITKTETEKKAEAATKTSEATKTSITALIRPLLTNIATLAKYTFKVAANFQGIKRSAESLKPDFECLIEPNSESCKEVSCATLSKCVGTTLSDLLKVIYPFLEAILGSVDAAGAVKQGSLFAIVDSAERIPGVIPTSLYAKLNAESYLPKVDAVVTQLKDFKAKLPKFTKDFADAMAMLNGVVATLNPEMLVDTMPIKSLPPVKQLEGAEELSKDIGKDAKAILTLPGSESTP